MENRRRMDQVAYFFDSRNGQNLTFPACLEMLILLQTWIEVRAPSACFKRSACVVEFGVDDGNDGLESRMLDVVAHDLS